MGFLSRLRRQVRVTPLSWRINISIFCQSRLLEIRRSVPLRGRLRGSCEELTSPLEYFDWSAPRWCSSPNQRSICGSCHPGSSHVERPGRAPEPNPSFQSVYRSESRQAIRFGDRRLRGLYVAIFAAGVRSRELAGPSTEHGHRDPVIRARPRLGIDPGAESSVPVRLRGHGGTGRAPSVWPCETCGVIGRSSRTAY